MKVGGGRPDAQSTVFVAVTRFDICMQQPMGFAIGFHENLGDALQIDRLDGAALTTTLEMTDMSTGISSSMQVDLRWTGIGGPVKAREHIILDNPGFRLNAP